MKTNNLNAIKHTVVIILAFVLPLLPTLLANVKWGIYTNIEQAVLGLLGAIYIALSAPQTPTLTVNGQPVTGTTITQ